MTAKPNIPALLAAAVQQHKAGKLSAAATLYRQILEANPRHADALHLLGVVAHQKDQNELAAQLIGMALAQAPDNADCRNNFASVLRVLNRPEEARTHLQRALALRPGFAQAHNNLGNLELDQGELAAAEAAYRKALGSDPSYIESLSNLGRVLKDQGRLEESIELFDRAEKLNPTYAPARANRAFAHLLRGDWARGWRDYLYRTTVQGRGDAPLPLPASLADQRLSIRKGQGLGDEIFFLRFVRDLKARGAHITYQTDPKLAGILQRLDFLDRIATEAKLDGPALYSGDLPFMLGAADTLPPVTLPVDAARRAELAQRLRQCGEPPYIGLTWRAGTIGLDRYYKQAPLNELAAALAPINATWLILQREPRPDEPTLLQAALGRVHDFSALNEDLDGMLALLDLLDDYVAVSNTNVHLRAGLSRVARILVPAPPEFRWMPDGDKSPWFPEFILYRQQSNRKWKEALTRLTKDLRDISVQHI